MPLYVSKLIEHTIPTLNPNVNDGLWVITVCQPKFIAYNECATLAEGGGEGKHV